MNTNKQIVQQLQQAISAKMTDSRVSIEAFFTDDAIWHLPKSTAESGGGDLVGKVAVLAMFEGGIEHFYQPDTMDMQYLSTICEGDLVHSRFTLTAKTANGADYANDYQALYKVTNGKVAEVWEMFDTAYQFATLSITAE